MASAKFDETVELAVKPGVNPKHADQQLRGAVVCPTAPASLSRFWPCQGRAAEAEKAGADYVGDADLIEKSGRMAGFRRRRGHPDMMGAVGNWAASGPKGLMPNPKTGTVTMDVARAVKEIKAGKIEYRTERAGIVHVPIGKVSFAVEQLLENFMTVIETLIKVKPAAAKGQYLRSVTVSSTMGPGVKINPARAMALDRE